MGMFCSLKIPDGPLNLDPNFDHVVLETQLFLLWTPYNFKILLLMVQDVIKYGVEKSLRLCSFLEE